ncbi:hypothetical protein [Streptomyces sp. NPDC047315]|uniref:hypothetical protein n=1 Tax=Streptomyces sp. NPDC047315 TaxID=3155142 RepID=UPI0033DF1225
MSAALATRPMEEPAPLYGPMRPLLHHTDTTHLTVEHLAVYKCSLANGETLRESTINGDDGKPILRVRLALYRDPVSRWPRYAVDYWSIRAYWAADHTRRDVAESAYEDAVRREFADPTLALPLARFARGLASFYDITDVA